MGGGSRFPRGILFCCGLLALAVLALAAWSSATPGDSWQDPIVITAPLDHEPGFVAPGGSVWYRVSGDVPDELRWGLWPEANASEFIYGADDGGQPNVSLGGTLASPDLPDELHYGQAIWMNASDFWVAVQPQASDLRGINGTNYTITLINQPLPLVEPGVNYTVSLSWPVSRGFAGWRYLPLLNSTALG